jgi:N-acetylmuramoyl-L-alanine amidase
MRQGNRKNILREVYMSNIMMEQKHAVQAPSANKGRLRHLTALPLLVFILVCVSFTVSLDNPQALENPAYNPYRERSSPDLSAFLNDPGMLLASIFDLKIKTIVLDAGHGGADPGAVGSAGTMEKDITLDIAMRLKRKLLEHGGYKVLMTREKDITVSLKERIEAADSASADIFISIHVNSLPGGPKNIIETFYFGMPSDEKTIRLAELENRGSPYRTGNFNEMIRKINNTMKTQESELLAASIQKSLFENIRRKNVNVHDNGTKTAPFVVLLGADMPSILAEISCISNREEEEKYGTEEYREEIAGYLEEGIINYLKKKKRRYES